MDVDVAAAKAKAPARRKRQAAEKAAEEVVAPAYEGPQPTWFLNTRTYERLYAPQFGKVFDRANWRVLGSGNQGTVYDTTILPDSEVHFPAHLNSRDHYAVKVQDVQTDVKYRKQEAQMALFIAQIQRPIPNVVQTLFWMRISTTTMEDEKYATIMPLVTGGTLMGLLENSAYIMPLYKDPSAFRRLIACCVLQVFAGICEVQAGGVEGFIHGDLHPNNVLWQKTKGPTCYIFDLGNGQSLVAATWTCNDSVLLITDPGVASGTVRDEDGVHTVPRHPWTREDNEKLCQRIILPLKSFAAKAVTEIQNNLLQLETILQAAKPTNEKDIVALSKEKTALADLKTTMAGKISHLDYGQLESVFLHRGVRATGGVFRQAHAFVTRVVDWLGRIEGKIDQKSVAALSQALTANTPDAGALVETFEDVAFLQKETGKSIIDLLRGDPLFTPLRVNSTNLDTVKAAALTIYYGTDPVEWVGPIELAPAVPGTVHHINARR